jgi:hypothetical protein
MSVSRFEGVVVWATGDIVTSTTRLQSEGKQNDLLRFHLIVLLFQRVDLAADQFDLLNVPGDCQDVLASASQAIKIDWKDVCSVACLSNCRCSVGSPDCPPVWQSKKKLRKKCLCIIYCEGLRASISHFSAT